MKRTRGKNAASRMTGLSMFIIWPQNLHLRSATPFPNTKVVSFVFNYKFSVKTGTLCRLSIGFFSNIIVGTICGFIYSIFIFIDALEEKWLLVWTLVENNLINNLMALIIQINHYNFHCGQPLSIMIKNTDIIALIDEHIELFYIDFID